MDQQTLQAAGWRQIKTGAFSGTLGGLWARGEGTEVTAAFVVGTGQANEHMGTVHGGALMTFADCALGLAIVTALGGAHCATTQLQMHFVSTAREGDLVTCRPEVIRRTSQLVFVRGLLVVGEKTIASADGIWKVFEPQSRTT